MINFIRPLQNAMIAPATIVTVMGVCATYAIAVPRTLVMRGEVVVSDHQNLLPPAIVDGAPFELRMTYDTSVPDTYPQPQYAEYRHFPVANGARYAFGLTLDIAGEVFEAVTTRPNAFVITLSNDAGPPIPGAAPTGDRLQLANTDFVGPVAPGRHDTIQLTLHDPDAAAFANEFLPFDLDSSNFEPFDPERLPGPFDVSNPAFDQMQFLMRGGSLAIIDDRFYFYQIAGRGTDVYVVPEPTSGVLALLGVILIRLASRAVRARRSGSEGRLSQGVSPCIKGCKDVAPIIQVPCSIAPTRRH